MNELRKDILLGRWVVILSNSCKPEDYSIPQDYKEPDEGCILCPENSTGMKEIFSLKEGSQWMVRVIPNPDQVLQVEGDLKRRGVGIYDAMNSIGANEIIIESPRHNMPPEEIGDEQMKRIVSVYRSRLEDLEKDARLRYILIYKNHGFMAGARYSHPHSLLMATPIIPKRLKEELDGAKDYYSYKERCIFCDIMHEELTKGERVIMETQHFVLFCPFAPRFPFEVWLMPKRHNCAMHESTHEELNELGILLGGLIKKMKRLFGDLPYNYVIHTAPNRIPRRDHWHTLGDDFHWHIEFMPRLLRTGGFEWGSGFYVIQTSPEDSAKYLREVR